MHWLRCGGAMILATTIPLAAGAESGSHAAASPTVLVLTRDGRVAIERANGWVTSLEMAGQSTVLDAGERYSIRNAGPEAADVVIVEVR